MEENKNEQEKKVVKTRLSTAILCFIILALTLGLIFMYLYYNKKDDTSNNTTVAIQNSTATTTTTNNVAENKGENKGENTVENKISNASSNNNSSTSAKESLDVNSELIKKLYNYIIVDNDNSGKLVYKSQKTTSKTIDDDVKYLTVFENLDISLATRKQVNEAELDYIYSKEVFEKKAKEIFGNDVELPNKDFSYELLARKISCENGVYKDARIQGGGDVPWGSVHQIVSAEKNNDEIIILDKYAYIYHINVDLNSPENGIYTSSDRKGQILTGVYNEKIYTGLELTESKEERNNIIFKNLEKIISKDKLKTYKHTFKKNTDGSYYWYSTEPIE